MIIFFIFVLVLFLFVPRFSFISSEDNAILGMNNTTVVKGFLVYLVLFSHYLGYATLSDSVLDSSFVAIIRFIGQLMVAPFFFFSGYGIFESVSKKKDNYINGFIKNRFIPLYLFFVFMLLTYVIYNAISGKSYDFVTILLSFTGWTSIGNSNWFIFDTFALYLIFACFFGLLYKKKSIESVLALFSAVVFILVILLFIIKDSWWYNTLLCFPLGMYISHYKERIQTLLKRQLGLMLIATFVMTVVFFYLQRIHGIFYCGYSISFCLFLLVIMSRVEFHSYICSFSAKHVFSIYIMQRLIFDLLHDIILNPYLYFIVSTLIIVAVAIVLDYGFDYAKKRIRDY